MKTNHDTEVAAILKGLNLSHTFLSGLAASLPEERLHEKRREGFWSLSEHAAHLAAVQPMLLERVRRILKEENPEFLPFIPDSEEEEQPTKIPSMDIILQDYKTCRDAILTLLHAATPEDWQRRAVHPEYAQYDLRILARHILMHDHWHMYRMEELWLTRDDYLTNLEG